MKRKHMLTAAILVVFTLLISSCGSAPKPSAAASSAGGKETAQTSEKSTQETETAESGTTAASSENEAAGGAVGGAGSTSASEAESASSASEAESASSASEAESASSTSEAEAAPAVAGGADYAWLGLQDMPKCGYLDALTTYHFIREYTNLSMGYVTECVEAVDGINTYGSAEGTRSYSVDGYVLSINDSAKIYSEYDLRDTVEVQKQSLDSFRQSGENMIGRAFVGTGKEPIPKYDEWYEDTAKYEYYEYNYPASEELGMPVTEKFYMKDGDVLAIYKESWANGESIGQVTEVIKSISEDIPEGTFDLPDLEGYEKTEL